MRLKRFRSMTVNIIIVALLCVMIVLPSAVFITVTIIKNVLRQDLVDRTQRVMGFNHELIRFQMNRARVVLETLAEDPRMLEVLGNDGSSAQTVLELSDEFDHSARLLPYLENLVLQETNCVVVAADGEYSKQNIANFFESDYCRGYGRDENTYVSGRFTSALSGRSVLTMSIPVIAEDGEEVGLVSAVIDIGDLSLYLKNLQVEHGFTAILDRNGNSVIDTRLGTNEQGTLGVQDDAILAQVARLVQSQSLSDVFNADTDGLGVIVSYQHYADDPGSFTVVNVEPASLSYELERQILFILTFAGTAMLAALVLSLWVTVQLSTKRLNEVTSTIDQIVKKSELTHLPEDTFAANDEVGLLGQSFNNMIDRIHEGQIRLEEARAKSDAILLGIGDGVLAVDTHEKIIMFNQAAEHISGFSAEEVLGRRYRDVVRFVRGEAATEENGFVEKALGGSLAVMPDGVSLVRKDGSLVSVADSSGPVMGADGKVAGAVVVFRDVTHEREVDRMKSEFVSVASHQLRTPLTAIRWYLEDLQSGEVGQLSDAQKDNVTQAEQSTARMIRLVNDLLDVSRLESGRLAIRPQSTDVGALLADVVQENTGVAKEKRCELTLELPKTSLQPIHIDPVLIRQVAMNLVSNAIKYSYPTTKEPKVHVKLSQDGEHYYRVEVDDNGMGISEKAQERIFQRFFRADEAVKQQTEGSGLGLYIAKLIIEESGGMISFSSTPGKGTRFWFLLPISGSKERSGGKSLSSTQT